MAVKQSKSINAVVAENLAYWMIKVGLKQAALAEKAGVSQKTISNYLNPEQRAEGSKGKEPSAKLAELERIAKALEIDVWQLTREIPANERALFEAFERAYFELKTSAHAIEQADDELREKTVSFQPLEETPKPARKPKDGKP